jgi:hypothetical protein
MLTRDTLRFLRPILDVIAGVCAQQSYQQTLQQSWQQQ